MFVPSLVISPLPSYFLDLPKKEEECWFLHCTLCLDVFFLFNFFLLAALCISYI